MLFNSWMWDLDTPGMSQSRKSCAGGRVRGVACSRYFKRAVSMKTSEEITGEVTLLLYLRGGRLPVRGRKLMRRKAFVRLHSVVKVDVSRPPLPPPIHEMHTPLITYRSPRLLSFLFPFGCIVFTTNPFIIEVHTKRRKTQIAYPVHSMKSGLLSNLTIASTAEVMSDSGASHKQSPYSPASPESSLLKERKSKVNNGKKER